MGLNQIVQDIINLKDITKETKKNIIDTLSVRVPLNPSRLTCFLAMSTLLGSLALNSYGGYDFAKKHAYVTIDHIVNKVREVEFQVKKEITRRSKEKKSYDVNDNHITDVTKQKIISYSVKITLPNLGNGSGTVIDLGTNEDLVLTCDHVSNDLTKKYIVHNEKFLGLATIVDYDKSTDLALLKLEKSYPTPYRGPISNGADQGDKIIIVGYPGTQKIIIVEGTLNQKEEGYPFILASADINFGESGGGTWVFDIGEPVLIGPVHAKNIYEQGIGGVADENSVKKFLDNYKRKHL